jgi:hypothetical protein
MVAASAAQVVAGERDKGKRSERITSEVPTCVYKKESVVWLFAFFPVRMCGVPLVASISCGRAIESR